MKLPKQEYTTEFKEQAVAQVASGRGIATIARELGMSDQTLRNWVKAAKAGRAGRGRQQGRHARADGIVAPAGPRTRA